MHGHRCGGEALGTSRLRHLFFTYSFTFSICGEHVHGLQSLTNLEQSRAGIAVIKGIIME
jgi:hypothetical protein